MTLSTVLLKLRFPLKTPLPSKTLLRLKLQQQAWLSILSLLPSEGTLCDWFGFFEGLFLWKNGMRVPQSGGLSHFVKLAFSKKGSCSSDWQPLRILRKCAVFGWIEWILLQQPEPKRSHSERLGFYSSSRELGQCIVLFSLMSKTQRQFQGRGYFWLSHIHRHKVCFEG